MLTTKVDIYKSVKSIFSRYQTISIKSRGTDLDSYFFNLVAASIGISVGKKKLVKSHKQKYYHVLNFHS